MAAAAVGNGDIVTILDRDVEAWAVFDGARKVIKFKKGTVIHDLKEPKTGTFTALVPEQGRRFTFTGTAEMFHEEAD